MVLVRLLGFLYLFFFSSFLHFWPHLLIVKETEKLLLKKTIKCLILLLREMNSPLLKREGSSVFLQREQD